MVANRYRTNLKTFAQIFPLKTVKPFISKLQVSEACYEAYPLKISIFNNVVPLKNFWAEFDFVYQFILNKFL